MTWNTALTSVFTCSLLACQPGGTDRPHLTLSSDARELRAAFNEDTASVRIVMLVAPT
jgi:hypothetical protein